jgi:hypothetical protein
LTVRARAGELVDAFPVEAPPIDVGLGALDSATGFHCAASAKWEMRAEIFEFPTF